MFRNISKLTASTFKYTTSFFSQNTDEDMTPDTLELCLKDIQKGLVRFLTIMKSDINPSIQDALFDDRILEAEDIFSLLTEKSKNRSPFYAYGYALFIYIKAMLSLEKVDIENALAYLQDVESNIKKWIQCIKKKAKSDQTQDDDLALHFDLLHANFIYMSATLQFLNDSWIDNFKAAYDLRKAFKMHEKLFQVICGVDLEHHENTKCDDIKKKKKCSTRRVVSFNNNLSKIYVPTEDTEANIPVYSDTLRYGVYFGIGLFNIVFLLLPIKGKKRA